MANDDTDDVATSSNGKRKLEDTYSNFSTAIKTQRLTSTRSDTIHSIDDFYQAERRVATTDDPSLHQGRVRMNQHIEGNFPTFVQISCKPSLQRTKGRPPASASEVLSGLVRRCAAELSRSDALTNLVVSPFDVWLPLHVSLSLNLQLKADQRDQFLRFIEGSVRECNIRPFTLKFKGLKWYHDKHATPPRHYLCLAVADSHGPTLNSLLWAANKAALAFHQAMLYYEDLAPCESRLTPENVPKLCCADKFHVSLAWTESTPNTSIDPGQLLSKERDAVIESLELPVTHIKVTIGDTVRDIALGTSVSSASTKSKVRLF